MQKVLQALSSGLVFSSPPSFPSLDFAPFSQQGLLIGSSLIRVNDRRLQTSLWEKKIIIVQSGEVQRQTGIFFLLSQLGSIFGDMEEHRTCKNVNSMHTHTHFYTCSHSYTSMCCPSSQLQSLCSLINELWASVWTSCCMMLP